MPTVVTLTPNLESLTQRLALSLAALQDAAKLGFDAIERGDSLALCTNQNVADFVQKAGHQAVNKLASKS